MSRVAILVTLIAGAVFVSAIGKVYIVHLNRSVFTELQQLTAQRDEMNIEWGRLQIEQAVWSTHARVEQVAVQRLDMRMPEPARIVMVRK